MTHTPAPTPRALPSADERRRILVATFFTFAPIGFLLMMIVIPPEGWLTGLCSATVSGLIAVSWAFTFFTRRFWLLPFIIPGQVILPFLFFRFFATTPLTKVGTSLPPIGRAALLAFLAILSLAVGFILLIKVLRAVESRAARARAELDLAQGIHATLVPPINLDSPLAHVHAISSPSSEMGGDLIDAIESNNRLDVLLGDVSGHGVHAGIVMAMLKATLRTTLQQQTDLAAVIHATNRVLADLTSPGMFATFAAVRIHPDHTIHFALAGHLPILHFRAATTTWEHYPNSALPLGIEPDEPFSVGSATVAPGDLLVIYTDGLTEVQDPTGRELTPDGLHKIIDRAARSLAESAAVHNAILTEVRARGPQQDDQSMVLIRIK